MVHHALSHGSFAGIPEHVLRDLLKSYAQEAGLRGQAQKKVVRQASRMLTMLRDHPIYVEIQAAERTLHELSFSWSSPIGNLYGVIDLLYQDRSGGWHLLDWKTEYVKGELAAAFRQKHQVQMAVYYHAVVGILGITPGVSLVCLNPAVRELELTIETLEAEWELLVG